MSVTSKLFLDKRHTKKDGTQAIKIRVTINRRSIEWSTGYAVVPHYWNETTQTVKSNCPTIENTTRFNNFIQKEKSKAIEIILALNDRGELETLSLKEIKNRILNKQQDAMVLAFCQQVMDEMQQAGKVGNARVYKTMRNSVQTFLRDKDIPFKQITFAWLKKYEAWYLGKGNSANGLSVNLRTLRALFNRAMKQQLVGKEFYPFDQYSIKHEKTKKRAITKEDIDKIKAFAPQTKRQARAKDYFLMSFYLMGASFIDLAFLKLSDMVGLRIEYKRKKTGQLHNIKITEPLQVILAPYMEGKEKEDYILNVITATDVKKQYEQIRDELRRYNRSLKEIGQLCGIEAKLTSYVARHSFASIANNKEVPLKVISQALGHSNPKTTEIYLSSFSDKMMDDYNELIIGE